MQKLSVPFQSHSDCDENVSEQCTPDDATTRAVSIVDEFMDHLRTSHNPRTSHDPAGSISNATSDRNSALECPQGQSDIVSFPNNSSDNSRKKIVISYLPFLVVAVGTLIGLVIVSLGHWRRGTTLIGALAIFAAVCRVALPTSACGLLHVRGKILDTLWYLLIGVLIIMLSMTIDAVPGTYSFTSGS